ILDVLVAPAALNGIALGHLPKQVSAAAGGVFFFAGDAEAGAHDTTLVAAALADAHAAKCGMRQAALVFGKMEMGLRLPRVVVGPETEIFVEAVGFDDLSGVHLPVGIPDRLELAEGFDQFRSKHPG